MSILSFLGVNNPKKRARIAVYVDPTLAEKVIDVLKDFFGKDVYVGSTFNGTKFCAFFLTPYNILYSGERMKKVKENATENHKIVAASLTERLMDQVKAEKKADYFLILNRWMLNKEQIELLQKITS